MERTLIILKPDAVQRGLSGEIITRFEKKGLQIVGMKMMLVEVTHLPTWLSLSVIAVVLTVTVVASLRADKRDALHADTPGPVSHE